MKTSTKILHWTPRILCILAILFISMFSFDAFEGDQTFWQHLLGFLIHLIPSYVLIAFLVVAWKWELIGGILFAAIGIVMSPFVFMINYNRTHDIGICLAIILAITFPFILIGVLFIFSSIAKKKEKKRMAGGF